MSVYNREKNRIDSNLTLEQFAEYMKQLNRDDIPLENRKMATIDHMMRIICRVRLRPGYPQRHHLVDTREATRACQGWASQDFRQPQHLLKLKHAEDSYLGFIQLRFPDFQLTWFQLLLIQALNLLEKDQLQADFLDVYLHGKKPDPRAPVINNLLITMPPRHAKTTYATINFPAYYIARNPARYCMSCSYNSELATGFGREVREAVNDPLVQQAFPKLQLSQTSRAADAWEDNPGWRLFWRRVRRHHHRPSCQPADYRRSDQIPGRSRVRHHSQQSLGLLHRLPLQPSPARLHQCPAENHCHTHPLEC